MAVCDGSAAAGSKRSAADILAEQNIVPSFQGPKEYRWIHRQAGADSLFFVASRSEKPSTHDCQLRATANASIEQWNPLTGEVHLLPSQTDQKGSTRVTVSLEAHGSTFL